MTLPVKPINEIEVKSEVSVNDKILILDSESEEARLASKDELKGDKGDTGEKGDKGDKGDTGATGPQGPQGLQGPQGDTGAKGDKGDKGDRGETGATGPQGIQGVKGDKGDKGDTGATGSKGDKGDKGDTGTAATITVGSTTTGDAGSSASVVNSGTSSAAVLDFTIPKGDKGDQGVQGETGPAGEDGKDGEDGADGNGITSVTSSKNGKTTTVTMNFDEGDPYSFQIMDGADGQGSGDMLTSVYDPNNKAADAFDYDNFINTPTLGTAASCNTGTSSGNVPVLDANGKLNTSVVPAVAITDIFTINSSSELTGLTTAEKGDIAICPSEGKTYILYDDPYSTASNWKLLPTPTDAVSSVNSKTGAVTLDADDISDSTTTNKFVTASDITKLGNLSGTNTGDQTASDFDIKDLTDSSGLRTTWSGKQDALVSGTNIKTINNTSLLGSGDITISGGGSDIEYKTQAEYTALLPGAASDGKHYFIYTPSIVHVTGVTLDKSSISLTAVGQTEQLTATVSPNDATDKSATWSSSDQSVATVDNNGLVTCVTPGTCTITVTTTDGGFTATCGVDDGGWQPGANTVAYYPLDSTNTVNDLSGNNYTLNNSGVTFGTYQGVDCAVSSGSNQLYSTIATIPSGAAPRTLSVWVYINSYSTNAEYNTVGYGQNSRHKSYQIYQSGQNLFSIRTYYDDANVSWDNNWYQHWINIIATYDGVVNTLYINGNSEATSTVSLDTTASDLYIGKSPFITYGTIGYISEVILENKAWSGTEVSDYFNNTKGNYGIS